MFLWNVKKTQFFQIFFGLFGDIDSKITRRHDFLGILHINLVCKLIYNYIGWFWSIALPEKFSFHDEIDIDDSLFHSSFNNSLKQKCYFNPINSVFFRRSNDNVEIF